VKAKLEWLDKPHSPCEGKFVLIAGCNAKRAKALSHTFTKAGMIHEIQVTMDQYHKKPNGIKYLVYINQKLMLTKYMMAGAFSTSWYINALYRKKDNLTVMVSALNAEPVRVCVWCENK